MKKKVIYVVAIVVFALIGGWNIYQNQTAPALSDVTLSNIEALTGAGGSCKWRTGCSSLTGWIAICDEYGVGYNCNCGAVKVYPKKTTD